MENKIIRKLIFHIIFRPETAVTGGFPFKLLVICPECNKSYISLYSPNSDYCIKCNNCSFCVNLKEHQ